MVARQKKSIIHGLRWDLGFIFVAVFLLLVTQWLSDTRTSTVDSDIVEGSRPPDRTEGDVLLLLPDSPSAEAREFDELDCSYGWFNSLWQEFGSFATAMSRDLSPEILAGRSTVIVPERVARDMPRPGIDALRRFVESGGQLIVERPPESWASLAGVFTGAAPHRAQKITSIEGLGARGAMRKHLPEVPLTGLLTPAPLVASFPDGPMLLETDGQPGILAQNVGKGWVYTFLYNHACTGIAMQQGHPTSGLKFGNESGPPSARVRSKELKTSSVPLADLLDRAIFAHLSSVRPGPRFWYYPGTHSGAVLPTLSAPDDIQSALGFADLLRQREGRATIFVASDRLSATQYEIAEKANAEIGILWVRGQTRELVTDSLDFVGIRPLQTELDLSAQFTRLNLTLPESESLRTGKIENSLLEPEWLVSLQKMAAARVRLDSSYGPTEPDEWGYLFGSGFPFYPIDERGLPLPMLESPFVLHGANLTPKRLSTLLQGSEDFYHQPITIDVPATIMTDQPSAGLMLALRDVVSLAEKYDHWLTTSGEFLDFLSARRRSVLTSQWSPQTLKLTVNVNILGARSKTLEKGAFPSVAIPRTYKSEEIESILLDGKELSIRTLGTSGDGEELIIEPGAGRHSIEIQYKEPVEIKIVDDEDE